MRRCVAVLAALVLVSGLSGCGRLLGQRYDNFTAYYNTFYNAQREFSREEEQLLKAERPVERDRYLTLFIEPEPQSGTGRSGGFAKAIEKGADLLREHPESKWVDDALLLIGKAYFYQGNFSGAEQKFRETIELDEDQHEDEAWLWLGRTLTATERYEDAALALREGLDREGVREEWAAKMRLVLAEVDVREGKFEEATASLREGLDGLRDDALAARAAFLLGQVFETTGRPARAAEAYGRVLGYGPRYQLAYAAQLSRALTLGLGGEPDRALEELRRMRRDDKNLENFAEIELTRARVLAAGRPAEARDLIRSLLYDPTPTTRIGNARGPAHYRLAEIYRDGLRDYVRAAAHYDTAATAIRQGVLLDEQATVQAITDAAARAETFGNYARVATEIAEMDSLLYLGSLDDEAFAEVIEQIRAAREREARERERDLARRRSEQAFRGGAGGFGGDPDRGDVTDDAPPGGNGGTTPGATPAAGGGTGFLDFRNPVQVQEELIAFQARWGDRPLVPNWRRAAAISGGALAQEGGLADRLFGALPQAQTPDAAGDNIVDVSGVPRDALSQQQMRADRAAARYELGNVLFLSLGEPDSASVLYRSVIDEDPDSPIAQRAYFALAEAQRALGNNAEAEELYADVIERYPDSRIADQARTELGLAPPERVAADSVGLAAAAYDEAYARWQDGAYAEALSRMLALSDQYPTTPAAARARLAAGVLYTEWAAGDEEALFAPEPVVLASPEAAPGEAAPDETVPAVRSHLLDLSAPPAAPAAPAAPVFTWVVASEPDSVAAAQIALDYRERGFDASVAVAEVEGQRTYRVRIGEFPGRAEALASRSTLPDDVPDAWLLALPGGPAPAVATADPAADTTHAPAPLPADSISIPTGLTSIPTDSTAAPTDSAFVAADSAAVPAADPWLAELYASIETDFPGTPFAERARLLRAALDVLRQPPPDSADVADPVRGADASIRGDAPIELRAGTFSWSVFASPDRAAAELLLAYVAEEGYRTALYTERSTREATYHVIVGQFATQDAAEAVRAEIERIPDTQTHRLIPLLPTDELEQPE